MENEITFGVALKHLIDNLRLLACELLAHLILFIVPKDNEEGQIIILWISMLGKMQGIENKEVKDA